MKVQVRLFSILRECLPPDAVRNQATVELVDGVRLTDLIAQLGIDRRLGHTAEALSAVAGWQVLINGQFESDMGRTLADGDQVQIFPPVAGGSNSPLGVPRRDTQRGWEWGSGCSIPIAISTNLIARSRS